MERSGSTRRLTQYRGEIELAAALPDEWRFEALRVPYQRLESVLSLHALMRAGVQRGVVLVATPLGLDPQRCCDQLDSLRSFLPWVALVVRPPGAMPPSILGSLLVRLHRHGAVSVLPEATDVASIVVSTLPRSFDPKIDLRAYLRTVLPLWRAGRRDNACSEFLAGFTHDPEAPIESETRTRRHSIWMQIGRAMASAVRMELHPDLPFTRVALDVGYSDSGAMNMALRRAFGVTSREVRGTVGWEWLLWRFLSGLGQGKAKRWDQ